MPRGDGSGPAGQGPETGRGAGFCSGIDRPGYFRRGGGFPGGRGFIRGGGYGRMAGRAGIYNRMNFPPMGIQHIPDAEYKSMLSDEAELLEKRLAEIKDQLNKKSE